MFTRRTLLKLCPAWLVALFVKPAAAATAVGPVCVDALAPTREQIIEDTASRLVAWMQHLNWEPHTIVTRCDGQTFTALGTRPSQTYLAENLTGRAMPQLTEFLELLGNEYDFDTMHLLRDLFKAMCRHFKFGPPRTNDDVNPGEHNIVRYNTPYYVKDVDELRAMRCGGHVVLAVCTAVQDLLAIPQRATAPILELDLFVRREAFMLEICGWVTQLLPRAVLTLAGEGDPYLYTRQGFTHWLGQFQAIHGRRPTLVLINSIRAKDVGKWIDRSDDPVTLVVAFRKEFNIELRVFDYSTKPDADNDTRIIG